jgi:hypothetical protein
MDDRRLVGIGLGISSARTVRVLDGDGSLVCRRKAVPTVASLTEAAQCYPPVMAAAIFGNSAGQLS